ncbi:unnamed protein product [Owenia fusiformis]|uniref:Uncharacterized protein n=1 Tax=Owenia fusiformis TaxID=6347 RepID=A0A8J1TA31_OWEFU|nr:unnamed protein product [Owenia fusiformis]
MNILGLIEVSNTLLFVVCIIVALYIYLTWTHSIWSSQGIKGPTPYPVIGTLLQNLKMGLPMGDKAIYDKFADEKVVGLYDGRKPNLMVKDAELLKKVLVKDFQYFINRRDMGGLELGKEFKRMLTGLKNDEWKTARSIISPTFSSGKIKRMVAQINASNNGLLKVLEEKAAADEMFEIKQNLADCTMNMIASVAFGIKMDGDSESDKELREQFATISGRFSNIPKRRIFVIIVASILPVFNPIINYFKLAHMEDGTVEFYKEILEQAMANRQSDTSKHTDFLQLMIKAQSEVDDAKSFTNDDILGNSMLFFLAGYETVSTTLMWVIYNMSIHQEEQEKVYEEVMEAVGNEDELTYDMLSQMTYLEMFIEESMRIFPPASILERAVNEDVTIDGINFPKNATVTVPVIALHHDPKIWPEPKKFIPERFTAEEKAKRNPYYYQPFGLGPRNCVAMRLAQTEVKLCIAKMVKSFKILPCEKTEDPIEIVKSGAMHPKNGMFIKVAKR